MNDLEAGFAEIEKRVRTLVAENKKLKKRIVDLEGDLVQTRRAARELEHFHGKKMHIREKIERILSTLEALETKESRTEESTTP